MLTESSLRMNHQIAAHATWSADEITERGSALAEKVIELWPGPNEALTARDDVQPSDFARLIASILAEIPAGRWTSYGEVARVASSYPQPVSQVIGTRPMRGAWRVLQTGGTISPGFRWLEPGRTDDPQAFLESEGLEFDADGHALAEQFMSGEELAELTNLEIGDEPPAWRTSGERPLLAPLSARLVVSQFVISLGGHDVDHAGVHRRGDPSARSPLPAGSVR